MISRIAKATSILLGVPWLFIVVWLMVFKTGLTESQITFFAFFLPLLHIALPLMYFVWAFHEGLISDIDITKRTQRFGIMALMLTIQIISLFTIHFMGTAMLFNISIVILFVFTATFLVTLVWKISLHMTINIVGIVLLNAIYDWKYMYLVLLLPFVFWSRLYLKKHTFMQLIAGGVLSSSIMLLGLKWFRIL